MKPNSFKITPINRKDNLISWNTRRGKCMFVAKNDLKYRPEVKSTEKGNFNKLVVSFTTGKQLITSMYENHEDYPFMIYFSFKTRKGQSEAYFLNHEEIFSFHYKEKKYRKSFL